VNVTPDEYRELAEEFRKKIGVQPLNGILRTAALANQEARAALMRAGNPDMALDRQLLEVQRVLEREGHE